MRDPIREVHGLLSDPNLHTQRTDRHHILGELLAEPERHAGQSGFGCHHRADHDHAHVIHQRSAAEDIVREIHRRVSGHLFRHGVRLAVGLVYKTTVVFIPL